MLHFEGSIFTHFVSNNPITGEQYNKYHMDSLKAGRKTDLLEILNLSDLETVGYNTIKNYFSAYNGEIFEIKCNYETSTNFDFFLEPSKSYIFEKKEKGNSMSLRYIQSSRQRDT